MTGRSGIYRFLILVIAAFAVAGCYSPVGSIGQAVPKASAHEGLRVEYQRSYKKDESFQLSELKVYTISREQGQQPVLLSQGAYQVFIEQPIGVLTGPVLTSFNFTAEGRGYIIVKYEGQSVQCPIDILPSDDEGDQTSGGIIIIWVD